MPFVQPTIFSGMVGWQGLPSPHRDDLKNSGFDAQGSARIRVRAGSTTEKWPRSIVACRDQIGETLSNIAGVWHRPTEHEPQASGNADALASSPKYQRVEAISANVPVIAWVRYR
jgi:hypothetical protein